MSRKTIEVSEKIFLTLQAMKKDDETMEEFLDRLARAARASGFFGKGSKSG